MFHRIHRDEVFTAGGQPTITYVEREQLHVERNLARAIATPNQIVSLSGPTKTGKTVLCKKVLGDREFVWVDGGQIKSGDDLWTRICGELNLPNEQTVSTGTDRGQVAGLHIPVITASGSRLQRKGTTELYKLHSMSEALRELSERKIVIVIDDFHYLDEETRVSFVRNIKGAIYNGLKVVLLSATHRVFDAINAEPELTGRFITVVLPAWSVDDLIKIPELGFSALRTDCDEGILHSLCREAQENPFLMQKFCWEMCFDCNIEHQNLISRHKIPENYDLEVMFVRIAKDAGLPIYQKLVAGPQSRKIRTRRPLRAGKDADIYEATLLALAETGPKSFISYEELRTNLNRLLIEKVPQKHETTSALKHLASISKTIGTDGAIDWDEDKREINIADPYLRFFLRWQVRSRRDENIKPLAD